MKNLIFDYDGTIHNSIKIYAPAFRLAYHYLMTRGFAQCRDWSDEEISIWLGFSSKNMWDAFMPSLPQRIKDECGRLIGEEMLRLLRGGKAELYPNALETLDDIKKMGYNMIFLSNCKRRYMQENITCFHLDSYFSAFYCSEDYSFAPKYTVFESICKRFEGEYIIIGDRFQDIEIAQKHGLKSIGCSYGYGAKDELINSTVTVKNVRDIPEALLILIPD